MNSKENAILEERLIGSLQDLGKDRGNLARLRRYWSSGTRTYSFPVLGRLGVLGQEKLPDALTAALFAEHMGMAGGGNPHHPEGLGIGAAALAIAGGRPNANGYDAGERHFRRLLASDDVSLEDVAGQLRRLIIRLARSKESPPLNYNRLLWDLRKWPRNSSKVKLEWARDFWQAPAETTDALREKK